MAQFSVTSPEFITAAKQALARERAEILASGDPVVFLDSEGRLLQEWPDGRVAEVDLPPCEGDAAKPEAVAELTRSH